MDTLTEQYVLLNNNWEIVAGEESLTQKELIVVSAVNKLTSALMEMALKLEVMDNQWKTLRKQALTKWDVDVMHKVLFDKNVKYQKMEEVVKILEENWGKKDEQTIQAKEVQVWKKELDALPSRIESTMGMTVDVPVGKSPKKKGFFRQYDVIWQLNPKTGKEEEMVWDEVNRKYEFRKMNEFEVEEYSVTRSDPNPPPPKKPEEVELKEKVEKHVKWERMDGKVPEKEINNKNKLSRYEEKKKIIILTKKKLIILRKIIIIIKIIIKCKIMVTGKLLEEKVEELED